MDRSNFSESFVKSTTNKLMAQYTRDLKMKNVQYSYMVNVGKMSKSACYGLLDGLNRELSKSLVDYEVYVTHAGMCYVELCARIDKK